MTASEHVKPSLSGETRVVPIVGDPIAQVKSPGLLSEIMARRGVNALVIPAHVASEDLTLYVQALKRTRNVDGVIFTVPHKTAALALCDRPSDRATFVGAVNVMHRGEDGSWSGDNTDGVGYLEGCRAQGFEVAGKTALLVGVGGAGSAVAYEILRRGAAHLDLHDLDTVRRDALIARLDAAFPGRVGVGSRDPRGYDLVGNATPLGMREGDPTPVDLDGLSAEQFVADIITKPEVSPLIAHARSLGCGTNTGVGMFNAQADLLVDSVLGAEGVS
jgi:shikimate dehydrogenase